VEFFASLSVAYLGGHNDFAPFDKADLLKFDPESYKMLEQIWNGGGEGLSKSKGKGGGGDGNGAGGGDGAGAGDRDGNGAGDRDGNGSADISMRSDDDVPELEDIGI
jgi:hypothetical protein